MAKSKSVAIIGGGVIGLCSALYALRKGHRVTLIERGPPNHDSCSAQNAGMIVPSHFIPLAAPGMVATGLRMMLNAESPFCIRPRMSGELLSWLWKFYRAANARHVERSAPLLRDLNLASRKCFEELSDGHDFGFVKKGLLMLCKTQEMLQKEAQVAEKANSLGIEAQVLTRDATEKLEPAMKMDVAGAVFFRQDCHLEPHRFLAHLNAELRRGETMFLNDIEVSGWRVRDSRINAVKTNQGEIEADEFVLACGSWSPNTLRSLNIDLPMQAGKGYSLTLEKPKRLPAICSILTEARVAVTPMGSSLRFAGTMEITGLDESINERRVNGIIKSIPNYFPEFSSDDFRGLPVWRGLRPCSPDGLPYVGRFSRYKNLCAATGHAMMGLSLGPITGKFVAEIVSDEKPSIGISLLSPDRFS